MELYEVKAVMDYEYLAYKENWEQARLIAYVVAQTNSRKKLKLNDIVKFHWESDGKEKKATNSDTTSMSNEELARLQNKAKDFLNMI